LLEEGRISPALASAALDRHRSTGDRFEEALIDCGLPESMLLRHLAEIYSTRFISTKTLAGAAVPKLTLQRLPRRLAERYQVVPIRFGDDDVLTVVATEPANSQLIENVRVAAGARLVNSLVARPAAIFAAIAKLYGGEHDSFASLVREENGASDLGYDNGAQPSSNEESFADVPLDTSAFDGPGFNGQQAYNGPLAFEAPQAFDARVENGVYNGQQAYDGQQAYNGQQAYDAPPASDVAVPSYDALDSRPEPAAPAAVPPNWVPSSDPDPELDASVARGRSSALGDASKLAESLMIIHERTRGSLKSHSVRVARLCYSLCRQLDLSEAQAAQAWAIGLFHDLGKSQQNHLTAMNVWQLADYEVTARAQYLNPGRLLKNADVPETVLTAIAHMYERFDGKGFPDGLSEEAIPFQSRVVALCDSVADLTLNPANTLGRIVSPLEACNHIRAQTPKVFDPTLLAHFSRLLVERKLDGAFLSDQSVHGIEKLLG
jgi:hypothetical protein